MGSFDNWFWLLAIGFSLFYGFGAFSIFTPEKLRGQIVQKQIHQVWLNFLGSLIGWIFLWFVINQVLESWPKLQSYKPDLTDLGMMLIAFLGVTGHLPSIVISTASSLSAVLNKIVEKMFN